MNITKEEFREIYKGMPILGYEHIFYTKPNTEEEFLKNYLPSKLWRLNNLFTIVDKLGVRRLFIMNKAQHMVYAASLFHPRLIILKSRQHGVSTLWLIIYFDDAITLPDLNIGLMAQGIDESSSLLEKTKLLWECLDPGVKNFLNVYVEKDNIKEYKMSNNSKIYIRTSFRSQTLHRLHISEFGKIANKYPEKAKEVKTGSLQALAPGNSGVIESTGEGDNIFKDEWDKAISYVGHMTEKDFYPLFLSWLHDNDSLEEKEQTPTKNDSKYFTKLNKEEGVVLNKRQVNFWVAKNRELGFEIHQEYPTTDKEAFLMNKSGTYFAELYFMHVLKHRRIKSDLYDKNLPVQLATDLGHGTMVLFFYQYYEGFFRFIHEFIDHGKDLAYYVDYIKDTEYYIGNFVVPHDAKITNVDFGYDRVERFEELGMENINQLEKTGVISGIEQVCKMIRNMYIDKSCTYLIDCLLNYKKAWNEKKGTWEKTPQESKFSHGADCLRYSKLGVIEDLKFFELENDYNKGKFDV